MDAVIRPCVPGDESALALIGQATFLETFAGILPGPDIVAHCRRQHAEEKYAAWLSDARTFAWLAEAEPGRAPIGFLVLTAPDLPLADLSDRDLEIKRVYLLRRFQGVGLGARLMHTASAKARELGSRRLLLGVYSGNETAIGFYERLGYRRVGERSFVVGSLTCRDYILGLSLT